MTTFFDDVMLVVIDDDEPESVGSFFDDETGMTDDEISEFLNAVSTGALIADGGDHYGLGMIALKPTREDAERIAVENGLPVEDIHLTLYFLGEADQYTSQIRERILENMWDVAAKYGPVRSDGFAIAAFNPTNPEKDTCIVLLASGGPLDQIQEDAQFAVLNGSRDVVGHTHMVPEQHKPWIPHLTLTYDENTGLVKKYKNRTGPITFDRICVAFDTLVVDIPLGDALVAHGTHNQKDHGNWANGKVNWDELDKKNYTDGQVIARGKQGPLDLEVSYDAASDDFITRMKIPNGPVVPAGDPRKLSDVEWNDPSESSELVAETSISKGVKDYIEKVSSLTELERSAVDGYLTEQGNRLYNDSLRSGKDVPGLVTELDSAIAKHVTTEERETFRGLSAPPGLKLNVGAVFTDPAYVSTTSDISLAKEFAQLRATGTSENLTTSFVKAIKGTPTIMVIKVPKGQAFMPGDSSVKENILSRGLSYRVTGRRTDGTLEVEII